MWVCVGEVPIHFQAQSKRFFLIHRSSLGYLETVLHLNLSGQSTVSLVKGANLRGVQNLLDFLEHVWLFGLPSVRQFELLLYQNLDVPQLDDG